MTPGDRGIPTALRVVAWTFIGLGVYAVFSALSAMQNWIRVSFLMPIVVVGQACLLLLGISVGRGLLKLKRGWRTVALILIACEMAGVILFVAQGGVRGDHLTAYSFCAVLFLAGLWQYNVLLRPDIKALFFDGPSRRWARPVSWRPPEPHEAYPNAVAIMATPDIRGYRIEEIWRVKSGLTLILRARNEKPSRIIFHGVADMHGDEADGVVVKALYEMPDSRYRRFRLVAEGETEAYAEVRALGFTAIVGCPRDRSDRMLDDSTVLPYDVYRT
jgi:hypothetical protein